MGAWVLIYAPWYQAKSCIGLLIEDIPNIVEYPL